MPQPIEILNSGLPILYDSEENDEEYFNSPFGDLASLSFCASSSEPAAPFSSSLSCQNLNKRCLQPKARHILYHKIIMQDQVETWLKAQQKQAARPEYQEIYKTFLDLYDKKLWHQLTLAIEDKFINLENSSALLIPLYENFIKSWEGKMNKIALMRFVARASRQLKTSKESLEFLAPFGAKLKGDKNSLDAYVFISMEVAHFKLLTGKIEECKADIEECEKIQEKLLSTDPIINASFYRATAGYPQYYHNALLFLSSVSLDDLSLSEKQERAFDLSMSALLGEGLYNFGELLMHPILDVLASTPFAWLRQLLLFYNSGDMEGFERVSKSGDFLKQPLLVAANPFLRQKLCLMTLMESVFKRSKAERGKMTFAEIAKDVRVSVEEVEHVVMKALSLGLVRGSIDEVDEAVLISWVQPRVLDKKQIQSIGDRIQEWTNRVHQQVLNLESEESFTTVFAQ